MKLEEVNKRTKEAVDFLVAALESGHSEVLTTYLGAMAKFHTYSFGNVMLIARQKPDATNVAGLRTWNSLGRFVKRGEKGIFILAPMIGKRRDNNEATTEEDKKSNGESRLYGFRAVYVFDVSQTEGKDLPSLTEVNGDVSGYRDGLLQVREIIRLHLNAELTTLSACDTGVGKLQGQEGISNLVEAFLVAGSKSVVASLWSADDTSASALMERFYQRLAKGESTSSALRNAKVDLLAKYGDQLSPFYWAAFITVGEASTPIGIERQ